MATRVRLAWAAVIVTAAHASRTWAAIFDAAYFFRSQLITINCFWMIWYPIRLGRSHTHIHTYTHFKQLAKGAWVRINSYLIVTVLQALTFSLKCCTSKITFVDKYVLIKQRLIFTIALPLSISLALSYLLLFSINKTVLLMDVLLIILIPNLVAYKKEIVNIILVLMDFESLASVSLNVVLDYRALTWCCISVSL